MICACAKLRNSLARLGQPERRECLEILGLPAEVERAVAVVFRNGSTDLSTYRSTMVGKPQKATVAPTAAPRYLAHVCSSKLPGASMAPGFSLGYAAIRARCTRPPSALAKKVERRERARVNKDELGLASSLFSRGLDRPMQ